jgi:hypothetical protein
MGILDNVKQLGDLKKLRDQAMAMQKVLAQKEIVVEEDGIRIVMTGDQQVKEFSVQGISNDLVVQKINKAIKLSQELAAKELAASSGGLGSLLGGGMGS